MVFIQRFSEVFLEYGIEKAVFSRLAAPNKTSAVRTMVRTFAERGKLGRDEIESVARAILGREELGSTGYGMGFALPHTRHPRINKPLVGWFFANPPIRFDAVDGIHTSLFTCLVTPQSQPGDGMRIVVSISELFNQEEFRLCVDRGMEKTRDFLYALRSCDGVLVTGHWPGSRGHKDALSIEAELAAVGAELEDLKAQEAAFWSVTAEADWTHYQAEICRWHAVLESLKSKIDALGGMAAKLGTERITEHVGRIAKLAAQAKSGSVQSAIKAATRGCLHSIVVEINGQEVLIRAKAKRRVDHESLRRRINSLPN